MTTASQAIEKQQDTPTPKALMRQYADSFAAVLPSHVEHPETWLRVAEAAIKKGKRLPDGRTELEAAASNNVPVFLATLLDAARLGLEPGTEQYYLTPRKVGGRNGKTEILGIIGYQGIVELMYRAGAVASVKAEVVYGGDHFEYEPGRDERPTHRIDWDAEDRGELRLVYAFAVMANGATSKVVVLNRADMKRIKSKAQGTSSEYSPWNTDEPAMWLKSAVRQLRKWVPTSSEYVRQRMHGDAPPRPEVALDIPDLPAIDAEAEVYPTDDNEPVDAEIVEPD